MSRPCKFCRIISGELPADMVMENECCVAFLDYRPLFPGHCLLVPKAHVSNLLEMPDDLVQPIFASVRLLCRAVEAAMAAEGTFVAINNKVSQSVPHLHVHIVPRKKGDGLKGFFWPRHPYRDETHIKETAQKIKAAVERM